MKKGQKSFEKNWKRNRTERRRGKRLDRETADLRSSLTRYEELESERTALEELRAALRGIEQKAEECAEALKKNELRKKTVKEELGSLQENRESLGELLVRRNRAEQRQKALREYRSSCRNGNGWPGSWKRREKPTEKLHAGTENAGGI